MANNYGFNSENHPLSDGQINSKNGMEWGEFTHNLRLLRTNCSPNPVIGNLQFKFGDHLIWHSISTDSWKIPQIQLWLALRYTEHLAVVEALALRECRLKFPGLLVACLTPTSIISTFFGAFLIITEEWRLWSSPYLAFQWKILFKHIAFSRISKLCCSFVKLVKLVKLTIEWVLSGEMLAHLSAPSAH